MSTLDELVHYSKEKNPIGALMLTGEWGCGKTYLIEHELKEALKPDHVLVRVSLFGIDSISKLHDMVRHQWILTCSPVLSVLQKRRDRLDSEKSTLNTLISILRHFNPFAGNVADAIVEVSVLDLIPVTAEYEDFKTHEKKHVILVFDDIERSKLDKTEVFGAINEYCENLHFNTIIVANEDNLRLTMEDSVYFELKEKIVSHTVVISPNYKAIVQEVLTKRTWQSQGYTDFLKENEGLILEIFQADPDEPDPEEHGERKVHNIRCMISSLQHFYRVYYHMKKVGIQDIRPYLYSFLAYSTMSRCGYFNDGKSCMQFDDNDIKRFYPRYSEETLLKSVRRWIIYGNWDEQDFAEELVAVKQKENNRNNAEK